MKHNKYNKRLRTRIKSLDGEENAIDTHKCYFSCDQIMNKDLFMLHNWVV